MKRYFGVGDHKNLKKVKNDCVYTECPLCGEKIVQKMIKVHVSFHLDRASVPKDTSSTSNKFPEADYTSFQGNKMNAFEKMMKASSKKSRSVLFYLILTEGKLKCKTVFDSESELENISKFNMKWSAAVKITDYNMDPNSTIDNKKIELKVLTNISPSTNVAPSASNVSSNCIPVSLLKSMIQKGVRRMLFGAVARLSSQFAHLNLSDLLRRIPIITVEDGMLHPSLPIIVWLMIATSKGYNPPPFLVSLSIQTLVEISLCPYRDYISTNHNSYLIQKNVKERQGINQESSISMSDLIAMPPSTQRTLIMSLLIRSSYGGMACDTLLLRRAAALWHWRFYQQSSTSSDFHHQDCNEEPVVEHLPSSFDRDSHYDSVCLIDTVLHPEYITSLSTTPCERLPSDAIAPDTVSQGCSEWGQEVIRVFNKDILLQGEDGSSMKRQTVDGTDKTNVTVHSDIHFELRSLASHIHSQITIIEGIEASTSLDSCNNTEFPVTASNFHILELPLRLRDLVVEGIDPHCDSQLIRYIVSNCVTALPSQYRTSGQDSLEEIIKNLIWFDGGCVNSHVLLPKTSMDVTLLNEHTMTMKNRKDFLTLHENLLESIRPLIKRYRNHKIKLYNLPM